MKVAFAKALKNTRESRGLTQDDFSDVSSRTYLSMLERGKKALLWIKSKPSPKPSAFIA